METKHLYKSTADKAIFGVCGGIAEYFGIDSLIVRLVFVLFCLAYGSGLLVYLLAALIIPKKPEYINVQDPYSAASNYGYTAPGAQTGYGQPGQSQSRAASSDYTYRSAPSQTHYGAGAAPAEAPSPVHVQQPTATTEGAQAVRDAAQASRAAMQQLTEQLKAAESEAAPGQPADAPDAEYDDVDASTIDDYAPAAEGTAASEETAAQTSEAPKAEAAGQAQSAAPKTDRYDQFQAYNNTYERPQHQAGQSGQNGAGIFGGQGGQGGGYNAQYQGQPAPQTQPVKTSASGKGRRSIGLVLLLLGALIVLKVLIPRIDMRLIWGIGAILAGAYLLAAKN